MKVIVCNIGSSSFKFQLLEMPAETIIARGDYERVGSPDSTFRFFADNRLKASGIEPVPDQKHAVRHSLELLSQGTDPVLRLNDLGAIGFKCVQGGGKNGSLLLSQDVLDAMEDYRDLAPAHNPPYLEAIYMFRDLLPNVALVGVFEPGFHIDAPLYAKVYGIPYEWIEKYGVKKYGYHGASHRYVTKETVKLLGLPKENHKIVTCHLGGSSSLCAYKNGTSIDTSMGFTPQTGVIQGTRIGDLDPFVLPYIMRRKGISLEEALLECSRNAGLAGLSGTSGDMRDVIGQIKKGSAQAQLARDKYIYDIKRFLGEFLVLLEGLDAVSFSGGIGQNDPDLREQVLVSLSFLGLKLDPMANARNDLRITADDSKIAGLVIETNEELVVARETFRVVEDAG